MFQNFPYNLENCIVQSNAYCYRVDLTRVRQFEIYNRQARQHFCLKAGCVQIIVGFIIVFILITHIRFVHISIVSEHCGRIHGVPVFLKKFILYAFDCGIHIYCIELNFYRLFDYYRNLAVICLKDSFWILNIIRKILNFSSIIDNRLIINGGHIF